MVNVQGDSPVGDYDLGRGSRASTRSRVVMQARRGWSARTGPSSIRTMAARVGLADRADDRAPSYARDAGRRSGVHRRRRHVPRHDRYRRDVDVARRRRRKFPLDVSGIREQRRARAQRGWRVVAVRRRYAHSPHDAPGRTRDPPDAGRRHRDDGGPRHHALDQCAARRGSRSRSIRRSYSTTSASTTTAAPLRSAQTARSRTST